MQWTKIRGSVIYTLASSDNSSGLWILVGQPRIKKLDQSHPFKIPQWKFLPYLSRVSSLLTENIRILLKLKQSSFLVKYDTLVIRSKTDSAVKVLFSVMGVLCARQYSVKENWNKLLRTSNRSGQGGISRKLLWKSNWKQKLCFQTVFVFTLTGFNSGKSFMKPILQNIHFRAQETELSLSPCLLKGARSPRTRGKHTFMAGSHWVVFGEDECTCKGLWKKKLKYFHLVSGMCSVLLVDAHIFLDDFLKRAN